MSESEKKKRIGYRKNREKWIFAQSVIIAVLTLSMLISALVSYQLNKTYYIGYNESGSIDYDVYLDENGFYDAPYLEKDQSYVAALIDKIIANFNYEIDMDAEDVNFRYSYSIKSRLEIIDDTSGAAIYNPEYELASAENKSHNSSSRLTINEIVVLNYDEYNELANKFLDTYKLDNTTSSIVVTLNVEVLSNCDAFSGSSANTYSSELRIPLTTKTVNIKMTSAVPEAETKTIACNRGAGGVVFKTTAIILGIVDVLMGLLLTAFIYLTRTNDITYTARVKKILSQYKSYIQKIKNLFETDGYQVIMVDAFSEMLEIRDTIQAPILMYENDDKTCAKFMIPTDSKLLYVFEIKMEGYVEPTPAPKPEPEPPKPTTIVKPNITNLVRPVVKVVVAPPPPPPAPAAEPAEEVQTVIEEAEIETEIEDVQVETVLEEPVVEEPVVEEPEVEEPEVEEPVVEEPVVEEPVVEEPEVEEPEVEEPVVEEPEVEEPEVEEPEVEEPVVEEPVVEEPAEEIVVEEPVIEEIVEEPVIEEIVEEAEPVAEEPAAEEAEPVEEETEASEEAVAEESDAEIESILASIPSADEETIEENANMVDAIDVFWKERSHKTYRYDPDHHMVEQGDIVLVPTRDVANDKNIVREAEVARGNYKVDAATLDRPLKKIIGVVKRKAEMIFTALITPDDENKEDKEN